MRSKFCLKIFLFCFCLSFIQAHNEPNEVIIFSMFEYKNGFIQCSNESKFNKESEQIFYYNLSDGTSGKSKAFSEVFDNGNKPEKIFVSNIELNKKTDTDIYKARLSYSIYNLIKSGEKDFYNMKYGVLEFEVKLNTKYEIPLSKLKNEKYTIYIKKKDFVQTNYQGLFAEHFNGFKNIADTCKHNFQFEFLRTNNSLTEIMSRDYFFPVVKTDNFYNTLTKKTNKIEAKVFYTELSFPFEIFNEKEQKKIPNYEKIKNSFIATIKVFVVPISTKGTKPEFDIYIAYSRFKELYYCEWNTIKKRISFNPGEKIKLELPTKDWGMRAFNPIMKPDIDWYEAYHKYVKEFVIISMN